MLKRVLDIKVNDIGNSLQCYDYINEDINNYDNRFTN